MVLALQLQSAAEPSHAAMQSSLVSACQSQAGYAAAAAYMLNLNFAA